MKESVALKRLHIVNGEIFAGILKASSIEGEVLPWRESLIDGPVCKDVYKESSIKQRARYFSSCFGVNEESFIEWSNQQLDKLTEWRSYDEIVLWFEYDLYDQAMLMSLLHWFANAWSGGAGHGQAEEENVSFGGERAGTPIFLMELDQFPGIDDFRGFGSLSADQVSALDGRWRDLSPIDISIAANAWEAFASADPQDLFKIVFSSVLEPLPLMKRALQYHLCRFPDLESGLSSLERDILRELSRSSGEVGLIPLFQNVGSLHRMYGLGDLSFWSYLERMRSAQQSLVEIVSPVGQPAELPSFDEMREPETIVVRITQAGKEALEGQVDFARIRKQDRWIGGVRHDGTEPVWRWDPHLQQLVL